jgi:hypothetical protein
MTKGDKRRRQKNRYDEPGRLTWRKETRASDEWMTRRKEDHADQRGEADG